MPFRQLQFHLYLQMTFEPLIVALPPASFQSLSVRIPRERAAAIFAGLRFRESWIQRCEAHRPQSSCLEGSLDVLGIACEETRYQSRLRRWRRGVMTLGCIYLHSEGSKAWLSLSLEYLKGQQVVMIAYCTAHVDSARTLPAYTYPTIAHKHLLFLIFNHIIFTTTIPFLLCHGS